MKRLFIISMVVVIVLILVGILFFFWASSATLSEKESSSLTTHKYEHGTDRDSTHSIVTYNIGHLSGLYTDTSFKTPSFYENNFEKAAALLNSIKPDIIAFQDIDFDAKRSYHVNQSKEFAKLGYTNIADAVYWDKKHILSPYWPISEQTGKVISGMTVLSKYEMESQERILLENDITLPFYKKKFYQDRIVQVVKLKIQNKVIVLINVHLENISKSARSMQFTQVLDLFKEYSSNHPTILLGDFNSSVKKEDAVVKQLFDLDGIGHSKYKNLDYIFYNKNAIELIDSRVLDEFKTIANHVPLLMNFKLKDGF